MMTSATTLFAAESIEAPNPISTIGIAAKVFSKLLTNTHYKPIGFCTWAIELPKGTVVVPAVEQFLPDLVVTVANRPETTAWIEAKALYENPATQAVHQKTYKLATGSEFDFGDDAGQINSMHSNDERTRVVNVIGSPAAFYSVVPLTHKPETGFGYPYYSSEADAVPDRTELAEIVYMATNPHLLINHDIGNATEVWGHEIPRLMRATHPSRFRASVVTALHAADIVTNKNSLHVTQSTSNSCGPNCVVSNVVFDRNNQKIIWQEVYPLNRNIDFNDSNDLGIEDEKAGNGNYVFVVWRKYRGCIPSSGKLIKYLSSPDVGKPQKR